MGKQAKRWRLSDVVYAMSRAAGDDAWWSAHLRKAAASDAASNGVRSTLNGWDYTLPRLLGMRHDVHGTPSSEWLSLTDEEREAKIVAEARRLKVPRRA